MFDSNKALIYHALRGWVNHVETGSFSGRDKATLLKLAVGDRDMQCQVSKLPKLSIEQQIVIGRLNKLAITVLNGDEIEL